MSKRALVASGLAVPLVGLAAALATPASAETDCIESTSGCRTTTQPDGWPYNARPDSVDGWPYQAPKDSVDGYPYNHPMVICRPGIFC